MTRHDGPPPDTGPLLAGGALPLEEWFGQRLERWHKLVRRDARRFDELDDAARHRLRRRAKRLRYAVEFGSSLYRPKAVEKYLARLRPAQDALGVLNDRVVATAMFDGLRDQDPRAWFALGWLRAERPRVLNDCSEALRGFLDAKPFWR